MKKILLFFAMLSVTAIAMSQIKIATSGNVAIGSNTTYPNCKLKVAGNTDDIAFSFINGSNIGTWQPNNGSGRIDFWHPMVGWNNVRMKSWSLSSDSTLKTEIHQIEDATTILKQIKTYSYYFISDSSFIKSDSIDERRKDYGVLAQEIKIILPELVDTAKGNMFVNYNAFIAILIKGFNEQQTVIETQQNQIAALQSNLLLLENDFSQWKKWVAECCRNPKEGSQIPDEPKNYEVETQSLQLQQTPKNSPEKAFLYQNVPNPFSSNTEIVCKVPESTQKAAIYIYDLQGTELKSYPVTQAGLNTIIVNGSELKAGMYLYSLVVDNELIDTKRMILTK